ncbi:MAG: response regulator [Planctomycetota bacterium]|nr:response regulator [Planctomycetota bacterium]
MGLVYVIEDEPGLRDGLIDALGRLPGVQALGFGLVQAAVDVLESHPPDLILTDLNLPERCGLDILGELDMRGLNPPVVLISGYLEAYREYIPERSGLVTLAKPFDLNVLLEHVQQVLGEAQPESQGASDCGLFEYLKLACLGAHTVEILVFSDPAGGELVGRVVVLGGQLWSVQDSQGMGADAFLRLACLTHGSVACNGLERTALMRNVYQAWDSLVSRAVALREGSATNPQFGLNPPGSEFHFTPPGPFEPPVPLNCAPPAPEPGALTLQQPEPEVGLLAHDAQPTLDDYLAAASAAEAGGATADAIHHLEQAMVYYPGHPEILLWVMRLKG